jgi:ABC-type antimicrobial peptide transport system permease subunit
MFQHSLLLIYRNFKRFKSTFFINWFGLSTGLACTVLIYLWVNDELKVDKFHLNDKRLFQVMAHEVDGKDIRTTNTMHHGMAKALAEEMPEIEYAAVATPPLFFPTFTLEAQDIHVKGVGKFAGKDFFSIFSYSLTEGNENQVLTDKNSIVISERLARSLFNTTQNILGKTVEWRLLHLKRQVTVSGVFRGTPANSSEQFDFVLSFDSFEEIMGMRSGEVNWNDPEPFYTYMIVREGIDIDHFNTKIEAFLKNKNVPSRTLFIKPYSDNYLYGKYENGIPSGGRIGYVKLFSLIALFILMIACINFMNLSTAKASKRIKEVGIKKAIGAKRSILIFQYLSESMLMSFLSLLMAIVLVEFLLPQFNEITGKQLAVHFDTNLILAVLGITLFTGFAAGSYPALYLSGFSPALVLKGKFNSSLGEVWARKGLVVFQFTLSVIFIVSVLVIYKQIELIQTKNLGYDKDNVLYFETDGWITDHVETFLSEVKQIPGIVNASSMMGDMIGESNGTPGTVSHNGKVITMNGTAVNYDVLETLGIEMKEGRTFSRDFGSDTLQVIYNEAAIEAMGIRDPVGKIIDGSEIVGVAKNFHFQSLHEKVKPFCFRLEPHYAMTIMVKVKRGKEVEIVNKLRKLYKMVNPGFGFDFKFLDQTYQEKYAAEKRVAILSRYFAGMAIVISCLGLFSLAAFSAERRHKEIGIRKVLGSSEIGIVYLLSADFTKMVMVSIFIALPVSYFMTAHWLDSFAYRIELEWWYFIGSGLVALFIAWFTIGTQTIKAARINPSECLKNE